MKPSATDLLARRLNPAWPLYGVGAAAFAAGMAVAATLVMVFHAEFTRQAAQREGELRSRIAILEVALDQATPAPLPLAGGTPVPANTAVARVVVPAQRPSPPSPPPRVAPPPAASVSTPYRPTPVAQPPAPPVSKAPVSPAPSSVPPNPQPGPASNTAATPAPAQPAQPARPAANAAATAATQAKPVLPTPTVIPAQPTAPASKKKIEGVSARVAGIKALHPDRVEFSSGLTVSIGQKFPSQETLIRVDVANSQITTNERQILIFFNQ